MTLAQAQVGSAQPRLKVHQAIARALRDNGVDTLFGLMGDANMYMVNSFISDTHGRFVAGAHESGCAVMALGYALVSNKVGVCSVTNGAAVSNTVTALTEGVKGSIPLLLLCGDTDKMDREHVQSLPQRQFILATGAGFEQVRAPSTVVEDVLRGLRRAVVERRPIAVNIPHEFDWIDIPYEPRRIYMPEGRATVRSSVDLDNAIGIIASSKRPVILAGRGAATPEARKALLALGERIGAPLATTLKAKDLFQGEPFNLGIVGTVSHAVCVDVVMAADCILAFGAGLNNMTLSKGTFAEGKRIIQVNQEAQEIGKNAAPDVGLVGDCAEVADLILHWLDEAEIPASGFATSEMMDRIAAQNREGSKLADNGDGTVDFIDALHRLDRILPQDRVYVAGCGRFMRKAWTEVRATDPRSFINTTNAGSIGLGMAFAIGAAEAARDRPTVLIEGDGGFMHAGITEFNTAVRHRTDLIVAICNDGAYGAEHVRFRQRQMDVANICFSWPDFASLASALGGEGVTVRSEADWPAVEIAIANRKAPLLIDIKLDPDKIV
ncbi:MAG: thiamine pyrophosphate-binding protein [Rhizobiaceae bacterium]|nr:thiamine pyrophosphate-binding protein [Rhizobiaceae bacterium]